jgi:Ribbon-helix-helix protein, copG family
MSCPQPRTAVGSIAVVEMTTVDLDGDARRRLRALARRSARSPEELIRDAISEYLEGHREHRLPAWVGSVTDAPPTDSSTIKREMRGR